MSARNSFEPGYFFRPDHLEMQLSYLAYQAYSHLLHGMSPEVWFAQDQASFYLISRLITAVFGIAMIVLAYLIGKRFARPVGLLSAMAVAFFPPFIENSHFATPDVPLACACMLVVLASMRYLESATWRDLLLACLGVSLAVTIKYPGALAAVVIAVVVIIGVVRDRAWLRFFSHGAGAIGAVFAFLFLLSPVLFTNLAAVREQVTGQNSTGHLGADGLDWSGNMAFYARDFAVSAGALLVLCVALGIFWAVRLRLVQAVPLMLGLVMWVGLSRLELHWDRWGLPMYVTPLLVAPIGLYYTVVWVRENRPDSRWPTAVLAVAAAVIGVNLLAGSAATTASFLATDTRTASLGYTHEHSITADNSIYEGYTPLSPGAAKVFFDAFAVIDGRLRLSAMSTPSDAKFVVTSTGMSARFMAEPKYVEQQRIYELLDEQFPTVQTWDPTPRGDGSAIEAVNTARSLSYLLSLAGGGLVGPSIEIHSVPPDR
ncbi:ArnT family glycosyltransferase [Sanguibacter gelidistatuariae]